MLKTDSELIKQRDIRFCPLHPDPDQAQSAVALLDGVTGIQQVVKGSPHSLTVCYDLRLITLQVIEDALIELGFHLDNSLLTKIKRALYHYAEETQRANLELHPDHNDPKDVFVQSYQQRPHGCRDDRPQHWREYL